MSFYEPANADSRPQTGGTNFRASPLLVAAFYVALLLPYQHFFLLVEGSDRYELALGTYLSMASVIIVFLALMLSSILLGKRIQLRISGPVAVLILLFLLALFVAPFGLRPLFSATYALAAAALLIALQTIYTDLRSRNFRDLERAGWVLLAFMLVLVMYHEVEFPRRIGGIQPNQWAKVSIIAMTLAFLSGSQKKGVFVLSALVLTSFAASRGGLILIVVFVLVYVALSRPLIRSLFQIMAGVAGIGTLAGLVFFLFPTALDVVYNDILAVEHQSRGLVGTGFTGRVEYWTVALLVFGEGFSWNMIFGLGFATRAGTDPDDIRLISAHQGYLNILLDVGFVGLALFLLAAIWSVFRGVRACRRSVEIEFNASSVAFICAYLVSMLIDPLYLRVGTPFSFLFYFLLVASSQRKLEGR